MPVPLFHKLPHAIVWLTLERKGPYHNRGKEVRAMTWLPRLGFT
jgi:hypothetical protein